MGYVSIRSMHYSLQSIFFCIQQSHTLQSTLKTSNVSCWRKRSHMLSGIWPVNSLLWSSSSFTLRQFSMLVDVSYILISTCHFMFSPFREPNSSGRMIGPLNLLLLISSTRMKRKEKISNFIKNLLMTWKQNKVTYLLQNLSPGNFLVSLQKKSFPCSFSSIKLL